MLERIPLWIDLSLHAVPAVALFIGESGGRGERTFLIRSSQTFTSASASTVHRCRRGAHSL